VKKQLAIIYGCIAALVILLWPLGLARYVGAFVVIGALILSTQPRDEHQ
jgi:hypothetical protein